MLADGQTGGHFLTWNAALGVDWLSNVSLPAPVSSGKRAMRQSQDEVTKEQLALTPAVPHCTPQMHKFLVGDMGTRDRS